MLENDPLCVFLYMIRSTTTPSSTILRAGVAQLVERVALINSKEINLKVVGSSPTFGYSYITSSSEQLFFCLLVVMSTASCRRCCQVQPGKLVMLSDC
jgi:hypothetical protein